MNTAALDYTFRLSDEHVRELPDGSLVVSGYASTYDADRVGDKVMRHALEAALDGYMKNPQLLYNHRYSLPAGAITRARVDDKGLFVEATVKRPGPDAPSEVRYWFGLVRDGLARAFSIGGVWLRDSARRLQRIELREISIATLPVNAQTLMDSYAKAFDNQDPAREAYASALRLMSARAGLLAGRAELAARR